MQTITKKKISTNVLPTLVALTFLSLMAIEPALAQGGLTKVNTFVENVLTLLRAISISVATIAIIWAGYKFFFKRADFSEVGMILAGGLMIGGSAEFAHWLVGS